MTVYVEPPEVVPGQIMSATNWKAWIVDVARAFWIYSAKGGIAVSSSSNELRQLVPGAKLSVLQTNLAGDDVEYADAVYVDLYKTSAQSIPNGTVLIKILIDTVQGSDPYGLFNAVNNRIVIPTGMAGLYDCYILGYWDAHATAGTKRQIDISHNGVSRAAQSVPAIASKTMWQQALLSRYLNVGDILEFHAVQESGVALNFNTPRLVIEKRR